jgi:hypothetical protein
MSIRPAAALQQQYLEELTNDRKKHYSMVVVQFEILQAIAKRGGLFNAHFLTSNKKPA